VFYLVGSRRRGRFGGIKNWEMSTIRFFVAVCFCVLTPFICLSQIKSKDHISKISPAFDPKYKSFVPTYKEAMLAKQLSGKFIDSVEKSFRANHIIDSNKNILDYSFETYHREYSGLINKKGDKIIYIRAFCEYPNDLPDGVIMEVDDGGSCYYQIKCNLKTKKCFDFFVNGVG
jgi:hypothetical protein